MSLQKQAFVVALVILTLRPGFLRAEEPTPGVPQKEEQPPKPPRKRSLWEQKMIDGNIAVSGWFDGIADGIDMFLVQKRLTKKKNETVVRIENASVANQGAPIQNTTDLNVDMRLPNVEAYWNLKFTTYDEKKEIRQAQQDPLRRAPRQRNYGATVGLFKKLGNVRTAFQPRLELQDPLRVSHSLTFESVADNDTYQINPKLEFFANPTSGTGITTTLNFNFELDPIFTFTFANSGVYEDKTHQYSVVNGFSLGQAVTDTSSLSYNLIFSSNNRPGYHLEGYTASIGWGQVLYKKILDYSCGPHLDFARSRDFKPLPGATLAINLTF